jgi:hypothetical protein
MNSNKLILCLLGTAFFVNISFCQPPCLEIKKLRNNKIIRIDIKDHVLVKLQNRRGNFVLKRARLQAVNGDQFVIEPCSRKYGPATYNVKSIDFIGYRTPASKIFGNIFGVFEIILAAAASSVGGVTFIPYTAHITYIKRSLPDPRIELSIKN